MHPWGASDELEIWIDRDYVPAGYGWSFPARDEVRVGVGSFDPRHHVKEPTVRLAADLEREAVRYQGNWIPHQLRPATESDVFFAGDSAGHCLPLTAEGIRTALYFGIACGRELRRVVEGRATRDTALRRYSAFSADHEWQFKWMLRTQKTVPRVPPRLLAAALRFPLSSDAFVRWSFTHYLNIAHPSFATPAGSGQHVGAPLGGLNTPPAGGGAFSTPLDTYPRPRARRRLRPSLERRSRPAPFAPCNAPESGLHEARHDYDNDRCVPVLGQVVERAHQERGRGGDQVAVSLRHSRKSSGGA